MSTKSSTCAKASGASQATICRCRIERSQVSWRLHNWRVAALGIIGLLATVVTPQVLRYLARAKVETARIQLSAITTAMELYALDVGSYPPPQAGLMALVQPPPGVAQWRGPYLKKPEGLVDPWGRPYGYRVPGRQSTYEIFSLGRDNAPGGQGEDQDIVVY